MLWEDYCYNNFPKEYRNEFEFPFYNTSFYIRKCIVDHPINTIYKDCVSYSRLPFNTKKSCKCHMKRYYYDEFANIIDFKPCLRDANYKIILSINNNKLKKFITCSKCLLDMAISGLNVNRLSNNLLKKLYSINKKINLNDIVINSDLLSISKDTQIYSKKHNLIISVFYKSIVYKYDIYKNMINIILNIKIGQNVDKMIINSFIDIIISYLN